MPELDSHRPDPEHPDPLGQRFSPWHAAGPKERYAAYKEGMRRAGNLRLVEVVLRLKDETGSNNFGRGDLNIKLIINFKVVI